LSVAPSKYSVSGKQTTKKYFSTENWNHVVPFHNLALLSKRTNLHTGSSHKTQYSTAYVFKIGTVPTAEKLHGVVKLNSLTTNIIVSYFLLVKTRRDGIAIGTVNS